MWVKSQGSISENVVQVTTVFSSHFVVCGDELAIIDTGVAAGEEALNRQLSSVYEDGGGIDYILLTHAHFDHMGGIPSIRKSSESCKLVCSAKTAEMLSNKSFLEECWAWNKSLADDASIKISTTKKDWVNYFQVDKIIGDGDSIDLGDDVQVKAILLPGHTEDTTGYLVIPDSVLQAGEAVGGYHGRDVRSCAFSSSYRDYIESLDKLMSLEIRGLGLPHAGTLRGDLAAKHLIAVREESDALYKDVSARIAEGQVITEIFEQIEADWRSELKVPEGPFTANHKKLVEGMVRSIAAELDAANS